MYLQHYNLNEMPFTLMPSVHFFCKLPGYHAGLNVLLLNLRSGEGFIKITGNVGSGKTLLCRTLLESLGDEFFTAYIPNPDLEPIMLRKALAQELQIPPENLEDPHTLFTSIGKRLMELHAAGKRVVLLVDEAQALPSESLETLRLLTNLETEKSKLLQVVLFGQPELDLRLAQRTLRQLKQRIAFSYKIPALKRPELKIYLNHRLVTAGYRHDDLFTPMARWLLFYKSRGVPRLINILAHKAMMAAYGRGEVKVGYRCVREAANDTEAIHASKCMKHLPAIIGLSLALLSAAYLLYWRMG